jgi:hypothetical protein
MKERVKMHDIKEEACPELTPFHCTYNFWSKLTYNQRFYSAFSSFKNNSTTM